MPRPVANIAAPIRAMIHAGKPVNGSSFEFAGADATAPTPLVCLAGSF
jgi:hypothetical protein